ncbi:MAG: WbqC family protein [Bacteroidia bacterium]
MKPVFTLHYLPCIAWFQYALSFETICIEAFENYQKQSYRSRCKILSANGIQVLNIPVKQISGEKTFISKIQIDEEIDWRKQHWQSLVSAYGKSAYFLHYKDTFEAYYKKGSTNLFEFNLGLINLVSKLLKLPLNIEFTSEYHKDLGLEWDYRNKFIAKNKNPENELLNHKKYWQVFEEKFGFIANLSILDLLFNLGPDAKGVLLKLN